MEVTGVTGPKIEPKIKQEEAKTPFSEKKSEKEKTPPEAKQLQRGASPILHRKLKSLINSKKPAEEYTEADKKLLSLKTIGVDNPEWGEKCEGKLMEVRVTHEGVEQVGKVIQILGGTEDSLNCVVQLESGLNSPSTGTPKINIGVPRQELVNAQMVAESENILQAFEGNERTVVETYIKYCKNKVQTGETTLKFENPEEEQAHQKALESVGKANGLPTADDVKAHINAVFPETVAEGGKTLSLAELKRNEKRITLLSKLGDQVIVDSSTMIAIAKAEGYDGRRLDDIKAELSANIQMLERQAGNFTGFARQNIEKKLADARKQFSLYKAVGKAMESEEIMDKAFDKIMRGDIDVEKAKEAMTAFRHGDMGGLLETITDISPEDKKRLEMVLKKAGTGSIFLWLLSALGVGKVIEELNTK